MASKSSLLLSLTIFLSLSFIAHSNHGCVYTVYVKTGNVKAAGTDSVISLTLFPPTGNGVKIPDLIQWGGLMGPDHDYFERGNLDIFSGRGPCLTEPVCLMNLTTDGTGSFPGWYCSYVDVTTTRSCRTCTCTQSKFEVEQWLDVDSRPYKLTAIRNNCFTGFDIHRDFIRSDPIQPLTLPLRRPVYDDVIIN